MEGRIPPADTERGPRYFRYSYNLTPEQVFTIGVESAAHSFMDEVLTYPVYAQTKMFKFLASKLEQPGTHLPIGGDAKKRGARVIRLATSIPHHAVLLLTPI
jgi:hypothetical protein